MPRASLLNRLLRIIRIPVERAQESVNEETPGRPLSYLARRRVVPIARILVADELLLLTEAFEVLAQPCGERIWVYTSAGGEPLVVRIVPRRADTISEFGDARVWSETVRLDVRVVEVAEPRPGDGFEIDGEAFVVQGEPVRADAAAW